MPAPWLFVIASPLKVFLTSPIKAATWAGSRMAAWIGSFFVWRKVKTGPQRARQLVWWLVVVNVASVLAFVAVSRILSWWKR